MTRQIKRTKKGRFAKGTGPGPGKRAKKDIPIPSSQEIRDAFYKAFVQIFVKSGNPKELVEFCKKNQTNMKLLITEIRKLLPEMAPETDEQGKVMYALSEKYMPKAMKMPRPEDALIKEPGPDEMTDEQLQKKIEELERKKASILAALAEKRPDKSKAVN